MAKRLITAPFLIQLGQKPLVVIYSYLKKYKSIMRNKTLNFGLNIIYRYQKKSIINKN